MKNLGYCSLLIIVIFFGGCLRIPALKADGLQSPFQGGASITVDEEVIGNEVFTETDKKIIETDISDLTQILQPTINNGFIKIDVLRTEMKIETRIIVLQNYTSDKGRPWKVGETVVIRVVKKDGKLIKSINGNLSKNISGKLNSVK